MPLVHLGETRGGRRRLVSVALGVAAVLLVLVLPTAAGAQRSRTPTPDAGELWQDYPLHEEPGSQAARQTPPTATATPRASPAADAEESTDTGTSTMVLLLVGLSVLVVMIAFETKVATRTTGSPDLPETTDSSPRAPMGARPAAAAPIGTPPDPGQAWTAEIEWRPTGSAACFRALARTTDGGADVQVAESPEVSWPPRSPAGVKALTDAAGDLAATLEASGWKPQRPGAAWYAKRFRWDPVLSVPRAEEPGLKTGRFWRSTGVAASPARPPR